MNPHEIQLFGLIALRALADTDPAELLRSTDLSKRELDGRIRALLGEVDSRECRELYNSVIGAVEVAESPVETGFLLRQVYASSMAKAQYGSLQWNRAHPRQGGERHVPTSDQPFLGPAAQTVESEHEELLRLATMHLLRYLRDYSHAFHQRFRDLEIDCILEPRSSKEPRIIIEARPVIDNPAHLQESLSKLQKATRSLGKRAIGVLITETHQAEEWEVSHSGNVFALSFDVRRNEFPGRMLNAFLAQREALSRQ